MTPLITTAASALSLSSRKPQTVCSQLFCLMSLEHHHDAFLMAIEDHIYYVAAAVCLCVILPCLGSILNARKVKEE